VGLLSFADAEDFEAERTSAVAKHKLQSSHDALNDPSLSKEYAVSPEVLAKEREKLKLAAEKKEKLKQEILNKKKILEDTVHSIVATQTKIQEGDLNEPPPPPPASFDEKMKAMLLKKRRLMDDLKKVHDEEIGFTPIVKEDAAGISQLLTSKIAKEGIRGFCRGPKARTWKVAKVRTALNPTKRTC
jgi:hypothetical protein